MGGSCGQGQSTCSLNEFNTVNPCQQIQPQPGPLYRRKREADPNYGPVIDGSSHGGWDGSNSGNGGVIDGGADWGGSGNDWTGMPGPGFGCGSIRQPVCSESSGGGCLRGMQQCCEQKTRTRKICRKIPYQVQEVITVPGKSNTSYRPF